MGSQALNPSYGQAAVAAQLLVAAQRVGWVERSDTHQLQHASVRMNDDRRNFHCRGPFLRHRQNSRITREILASGHKARSKVMGFASAQPILRAVSGMVEVSA